MLLSLTTCEQFGEIIGRIGKITFENHDWIAHLPPHNETFFSLLGVDEGVFSLPKGEFESALRCQYRTLNRAPLVNLAYTVLKSPSLRENYLWMCEHYEFQKVEDAINAAKEKPTPDEVMEKMIEQTLRRMGKQGMPFFPHMDFLRFSILARIYLLSL
jgi:hypothetical protein